MKEVKPKNKQILIAIILVIGIVSIITGVTYAFFNYTRTGSASNIGTGRIFFHSEQNNTLNVTNVFPLTSEQANSAILDEVSLVIEGDTTYFDGEEYKITLTGINNTINGKKVPINYIATYTANTDKVIGTSSNNYWNARNSKNTNIYTLNSTGDVKEGTQVLVGYIDNGATGIDGTLKIKAYIDADRIVISDTYPAGPSYQYNTNRTSEEINSCVTYFTNLGGNTMLQSGETLEAFCDGTGTMGGLTFQQTLDSNGFSLSMLNDLVAMNIIINNNYINGTPKNWVDGRVVLTTSEWNSLQNNLTPLSFQIKAESNEGIWVDESISTCPNCKFIYTTSPITTTWNTSNRTPTVLNTNLLEESFRDVVEASGKNYFLGVVTNNNNEVTNAYACGIYNGTPFCIEGDSKGANYITNKTILNGSTLWNNSCTVQASSISCGTTNGTALYSTATSNGHAVVGISDGFICTISSPGLARCMEITV